MATAEPGTGEILFLYLLRGESGFAGTGEIRYLYLLREETSFFCLYMMLLPLAVVAAL